MAVSRIVILALVAVAYVSASSYKPTHPVYPPHKPSYYVYEWGQWGQYGDCSKPCGGGVQYRYRTCERRQIYGYGSHGNRQCAGPNSSQRWCNLQCCPVNGGWTHWSNWSNSYHGSYQQTRTRSCSNPRPSCGGRQCYGSSTETRNVHQPHYKKTTSYLY